MTLVAIDALEGLEVEVEQRALAADAGVENERVEAVRTGSIVSATTRPASSAARPCRRRAARPPISLATSSIGAGPPSRHGDRVAVGGKPPGDRRADARAAAGDERGPAHAAQVLDDLLVVDGVAEGEPEALADA